MFKQKIISEQQRHIADGVIEPVVVVGGSHDNDAAVVHERRATSSDVNTEASKSW